MQIFMLSLNPEENAQFHMDSHVVRFPMELQSILIQACARMRIRFPQIKGWNGMPVIPNPKLYNNPYVKWAALDEENFEFIKNMALQLCHEYQFRFGNLHNYLGNLLQFPEFLSHESPRWSRFPISIPMSYRNFDQDIVWNYRRYYIECKHHLSVWTARGKPEWFPLEAVQEGKKIREALKHAKHGGEIDGMRLKTTDLPEGI